MKGVFKYTALAVTMGLMGSTAAMAATKGDSIINGTGTIKVTATVKADTCAVNWPTTTSTINLEMDKVKDASFNTVMGSVEQQFTLSNCNAKSVNLAFSPTNIDEGTNSALPDDITKGSQAPLMLYASLKDSTGVQWANGSPYTAGFENGKISMASGKYVTITPDTDSAVYNVVNTITAGANASNVEAKAYDFTYTYTMTYA